MKRSTWITAAVLLAMVGVILVALVVEVDSGPTFRPEDYGSHQECIENIPAEWAPGSMHRSGAEDACMFVHRRGPQGG